MTRLHIYIRPLLCPFSELVAYFPVTGNILDFGCGYGLFLQLLCADAANQGRRLFGIDHDQNKINIAKRYEHTDLEFSQERIENLPGEKFDAISIMDVLYSINMDEWRFFLDHCFRLLRPGGRLIIKEAVNEPRWKYWMTLTEEVLALRFFRITYGQNPHIESRQAHINALEKSGFHVTQVKQLKSFSWISHCLFIAYKEQ